MLDSTENLDAWAAEAQAYVQKAFGEPLTLNPVAPAGLPHFLLDRYRLWQGTLLDRPLLLAAGKNRRTGMGFTTDFAKHREVLRRNLGDQPVVLLLEHSNAAVRRQMIERRIGFLAPGSQLYIPEVLLDWRERDLRARAEPTEHIAPTTQLVLTAALLGERLDDANLTELAGRFRVAVMSMTRALDELETLQIAKARHVGRQRRLHFTMRGRELWEFVKDRLQSPVRKLRTIEGDFDETVAPQAGESALAHYTMLASPRIVRRAIDAARWKEFGSQLINVDEVGFDENRVELETWRYDPVVLAKDGVVDPISLYLSVRNNTDERVEQAAEQLMEQFRWS